MNLKKFFHKEEVEAEAIAVLVGTIIGAGVLGIPYTIAQSGFLLGTIMIIFLGFAVLMTNLFIGEVTLRTKGTHQLTGYAEKYLGKNGKKLMTFTMIFGTFGALIAYIIGEGEALAAIFGGEPLLFSLFFFAIMAFIVFIGLNMIKKIELILSLIVLTIIIIISLASSNQINLANLATMNLSKFFMPFGVILFAFLGAAAIPEMKVVLQNRKKDIKKAIIIGSLIPLIAYFIFAAITVGVTGINTTEIATIGLGEVLGQNMVLFGNIFAIFAMATSFLTLALALKWMFHYDYHLNKTLSWALTCLIPLTLFLVGIKSFIKTIGITGAIAGGLEGTLIISMFMVARKKGDRKPEYQLKRNLFIAILLGLVYIGGIVYTIYNLI